MTVNFKKLEEVYKTLENYKNAKLLVVTKNRDQKDILELINKGNLLFGENRVQEAENKFQELKKKYPSISLHLIGPLQSNKTINALKLFNCIQSIDREKIVNSISPHTKEKWCFTKSFYIQINIGYEEQKSGVYPEKAKDFYYFCLDKGLKVNGLMCIPPNTLDVDKYFLAMNDLRSNINKNLLLSMGMSNDYLNALSNKSDLIRLGSLLFK